MHRAWILQGVLSNTERQFHQVVGPNSQNDNVAGTELVTWKTQLDQVSEYSEAPGHCRSSYSGQRQPTAGTATWPFAAARSRGGSASDVPLQNPYKHGRPTTRWQSPEQHVCCNTLFQHLSSQHFLQVLRLLSQQNSTISP